MFGKTPVKEAGHTPLYDELAKATGERPKWNFHKYLIARDGKTVTSFKSDVEPESKEFVAKVEEYLSRSRRYKKIAAPRGGFFTSDDSYYGEQTLKPALPSPLGTSMNSLVFAWPNTQEAEVLTSFGPAIPGWLVYPHEFTEMIRPSPVEVFERLRPRSARGAAGKAAAREEIVLAVEVLHALGAVHELGVLAIRIPDRMREAGSLRHVGDDRIEAHRHHAVHGDVEGGVASGSLMPRIDRAVIHDIERVVPLHVVGERARRPVRVDHTELGHPAPERIVSAITVGRRTATRLVRNEHDVSRESLVGVVVHAVGGRQDQGPSSGVVVAHHGAGANVSAPPRLAYVGRHFEVDSADRFLDHSATRPLGVRDRISRPPAPRLRPSLR
jgi:hypothetical protein